MTKRENKFLTLDLVRGAEIGRLPHIVYRQDIEYGHQVWKTVFNFNYRVSPNDAEDVTKILSQFKSIWELMTRVRENSISQDEFVSIYEFIKSKL